MSVVQCENNDSAAVKRENSDALPEESPAKRQCTAVKHAEPPVSAAEPALTCARYASRITSHLSFQLGILAEKFRCMGSSLTDAECGELFPGNPKKDVADCCNRIAAGLFKMLDFEGEIWSLSAYLSRPLCAGEQERFTEFIDQCLPGLDDDEHLLAAFADADVNPLIYDRDLSCPGEDGEDVPATPFDPEEHPPHERVSYALKHLTGLYFAVKSLLWFKGDLRTGLDVLSIWLGNEVDDARTSESHVGVLGSMMDVFPPALSTLMRWMGPVESACDNCFTAYNVLILDADE